MAGLADLESALKEWYLPPFRTLVNNASDTYNRFRKNTTDFAGLEAFISIKTQSNNSIGARAEFEDLAPAGSIGISKLNFTSKKQTARLNFSTEEIEVTKSQQGSFVQSLQVRLEDTAEVVKRDLNRQIFGTSDGVLAATAVNTAVNIIQLAASTPESIMRFFEVGMAIDLGDVATPQDVATNRTITDVNITGKTITISGAAVTTDTGDRVFRFGNGGVSPQREVTGLQTMTDDTAPYFNINPSTVTRWRGVVLANGGTPRPPSQFLFLQIADQIYRTGQDAQVDLFVTTFGVLQSYAAELVNEHRYNDANFALGGGYDNIRIHTGRGPVEAIADRDCPTGQAFALNTKKINQYVVADWRWDDRSGSILFPLPNTMGYEARLYAMLEFATWARNSHGVIRDLAEYEVAPA